MADLVVLPLQAVRHVSRPHRELPNTWIFWRRSEHCTPTFRGWQGLSFGICWSYGIERLLWSCNFHSRNRKKVCVRNVHGRANL